MRRLLRCRYPLLAISGLCPRMSDSLVSWPELMAMGQQKDQSGPLRVQLPHLTGKLWSGLSQRQMHGLPRAHRRAHRIGPFHVRGAAQHRAEGHGRGLPGDDCRDQVGMGDRLLAADRVDELLFDGGASRRPSHFRPWKSRLPKQNVDSPTTGLERAISTPPGRQCELAALFSEPDCSLGTVETDVGT